MLLFLKQDLLKILACEEGRKRAIERNVEKERG